MFTKDLIKALGVSHTWIATYMRELGERRTIKGEKRKMVVIDYPIEKIMQWLNENATFERQTIRIPLSFWGKISDNEARAALDRIAVIEDKEAAAEAMERLLERAIPPNIRERDNRGSHVRRRIDPWVSADMQIENLYQLRTIRSILDNIKPGSRSVELAYRYAYTYGMIRVTIHGRTWFMEDPHSNLDVPDICLPAELF